MIHFGLNSASDRLYLNKDLLKHPSHIQHFLDLDVSVG